MSFLNFFFSDLHFIHNCSFFLYNYFFIVFFILIFLLCLNIFFLFYGFFGDYILLSYKSPHFKSHIFYTFFYKLLFICSAVSILFLYFYTLYIIYKFDFFETPYQLTFSFSFFSLFSIFFGLDNLSALFVLLLTFLVPLCLFLTFLSDIQGKKNFIGLILLLVLELVLFCFFTISDFFGFYMLFEGSMIPVYFLLGLFGSRINKIKASFYFFLFTFLGGLFFLMGLFILYFLYGTAHLYSVQFLMVESFSYFQYFLWICFFIPFAIKIPIVPFHMWLPEAHVEASTEGSVLLAGLLLKLGGYGFLRFLFPLMPSATIYFTPMVEMLCLISIIYTSFLVFYILDIKKIIAYSSIAHMNFSLLGLISGSVQGMQGATFLMFTHGIISSGLFIVIGLIYARYHTRLLSYYQGLAYFYPLFSFFFFILILGNFGFPGTGGFIGEFLIIVGLFEKNWILGFLSMLGPLLCGIYSMLLFTKMVFGVYSFVPRLSVDKPFNTITSLEFSILSFLSIYTLLTGLFPNVYLYMCSSYINYLYILLNF